MFMKKFMLAVTAVSLSAMMLAGCGKEADKQENTAATEESVAATEESGAAAESEVQQKEYPEEAYLDNLNVGDYVTLGDYVGVEVSVEAAQVTDEQVDSYISNVLNNNKIKNEVTDRAVKEGDVTDISYVGKKDGVAFEGGTADNYELTIGSNTFIDGFEDGVIGMKTGETKDLNLTFPENYQNADLAGAKVVFTVTLNKIYEEELPELNDEFVAGLGVENVSNVEEYKKYVYDNLMKTAQAQHDMEAESAVLKAVCSNAVVKAAPEAMTERYYDRLVSNLTYQASMYGFDLETFMLYGYGMTTEQYEEEMKVSAKEAAEQVMVLQAIAEKEGMTVSDEDMEKDIEENASNYGYESADAYKEALGTEIKGYREYMMTEKVTAYLVENAKVNDAEPQDIPETASETETGTETQTASETETQTAAE